ncbi:MAG: DUF2029 domain-containing protein [Anaerolineae bacterium]|nr:DUF2029 domain-containing protein [Anaerolineae bacterium]
MRYISFVIFAIIVSAIAVAQPNTDVTKFFTPAAHIIAQGGDPYALSSEAWPFVYPPYVLPLLIIYGLPGAYVLAVLANAGAALLIVRAQRVNWAWLLYPPVLSAICYGTFDLPVVALAMLAYRRRNPVLMALALLIKPQAAVFWLVPMVIEQPRAVWRMAATGIAVIVMSLVLMPDTWGSWLAAASANARLLSHYAVNSYSVFAVGAIGAWGALSRLHEKQWRALTALLLPFVRYYSAVGLIGYGGAWVVALAWVLIALLMNGVRVLWIEPMVVLGVAFWIERQSNTSSAT